MAAARRRWNPDEKRAAIKMSKEGFTHKEIAEKLRPGVKFAWRAIGEIVREARKPQEHQSSTTTSTSIVLPISPLISSSSTIELPEGMADSLTAKEFMSMMDDHQRALFVATYEDLRGDADDDALTGAENEMLIRASYSHVKYLRAQALLNIAEGYLMQELEGLIPDTDAGKAMRRFAGGREGYKKECEQWQKEYMDYLNDLKLTRRQRLDKIKDIRNTFLDLQQELNDQERQASIIEDIKRINLATEAEFHRMAKGQPGPDGRLHSWLIGAFDEYVGPADPPEEEKNEEND